jgi:hypothetical protein
MLLLYVFNEYSFSSKMVKLKIPDHQVAGHQAKTGIIGPLIDDSGKFYKPLQDDDRRIEAPTNLLSTPPSIPIHESLPTFSNSSLLFMALKSSTPLTVPVYTPTSS